MTKKFKLERVSKLLRKTEKKFAKAIIEDIWRNNSLDKFFKRRKKLNKISTGCPNFWKG